MTNRFRLQPAILVLTAFVLILPRLDAQHGQVKITSEIGVDFANVRVDSPANKIAEGFGLQRIAQGSDPLENPSGIITRFGLLNDFPPQLIEPTRTEADENTYLVFDSNPGGPTAGYDYGRHFLYQGHENSGDRAYITRINLDITDPAHRITLLTPVNPATGKTGFNSIDGSTWNPFTRTLLFTQERGANGGVIEVSAGWPPVVHTLDGILGKGGYEGIHPDNRGNLLIIEDAGGVSVTVNPADPNAVKVARQPNSFVYRFIPYSRDNLSLGGKLQALQVSIDSQLVTFHPADPVGDTFSVAQLKLHTLGTSWPAVWVTVHDTAVDGTAAFDANAAAKKAGATPFKRPENAQFLPGSGFNTFFFCPTGDTNALSGGQPALAARGAWGSIFRVDFRDNDEGKISILVLGDAEHSAFDNLAFADESILLAAEDRGDGFHKQLNRLDSIWAYDVRQPEAESVRFLALGRDSASEADAVLLDAATPGFQNEGDNEPTGLHVSEGSDTVTGLAGKPLNPDKARWFVTQQHGLNQVFEIVRTEH